MKKGGEHLSIVDALGRLVKETPVKGAPGMTRIDLTPSTSGSIRAEIEETEESIIFEINRIQAGFMPSPIFCELADLRDTVKGAFNRLLHRT